jgi:hypothetical protein
MLRTMFAGLKESFSFEQPLIERVSCEDEVDREFCACSLKLAVLGYCLRIWR